MPEMQDHELYRRILGYRGSSFVDPVELKLDAGEIHVHLGHHEMTIWQCPECGTACKPHDHQPERQWPHPDMYQHQTILHANRPAVTHGVKVIRLPWAEPSSFFTALFEALAIEWLKAGSQKR